MSEKKAIKATDIPHTKESIKKDLEKIGLKKGMTVLVHTSLNSIGWVCGGPVTIIQALMEIVTCEGTIIMPTHSTDYSDPVLWENPPVPNAWWDTIRDSMPEYSPEITPTRGMGIVAETFRKCPNVIRSCHPQVSFAAWGKNAEQILNNHSIDYGLGENSPLANIYKFEGQVFLLGVEHSSNTSFHLAEYRIPQRVVYNDGAPIIQNGKRVWVKFKDIELNEELFDDIGIEFEREVEVSIGNVGNSISKLFSQKKAVDFAEKWLLNYKKME